MQMLFDHHTHSHHSFDGSEPIEALAEAAVSRGLHALAVTDHCDLGLQCVPNWEERLSGSMEEISKNRAAFQGKLTLLAGIELGQPLHDLQHAADVLGRFSYDLVIGSLHNLRETEDFYFLQDAGADPRMLLDRYFDELLEMTRWGGFDILAHLTYPYRYLGYTDTPPIACFEEKLREIFTGLAHGGKALELNTSGLVRSPGGRTSPGLWELRLFRECGGEFVTLGSDAHRCAHVGGGIREGLELLRAAGFRYQASFSRRRAAAFPI